jgi:hypothetical protein
LIVSELSPTTQAVLDAFRSSHTGQGCLAAALHEVARQVVPDDLELSKRSGEAVRLNRLSICRQIHAIADELQAQ